MQKSDPKRNTKVYILDYIFGFFFIPIAVWPLLYGKYLTFTQIGFILSVGFIVQAVLDMPSSALGDLIGRKRVLIISRIVRIVGHIFYIFITGFNGFLIAAIVDQIAEAFYSSGAVALIYDSLKENHQESNYKNVESRGYFWATVFFIVASALGGIFYAINPRLPYIAMLIPDLLALIAVTQYQEPQLDSEKASLKGYFKQIYEGFRHIFREKSVALVSLYSLVISFVFYSGLWWLYQKAGNEFGLPVIFVGLLISLMYSARALGTWIYRKYLFKYSEENFGIFLAFFQAIGSFIVAIPQAVLGIFGLGMRYGSDGFQRPFLSKLQNDRIESKYRATALSAVTLLTTVALAVTSPLAGKVIDLYGARLAIAGSGILSLILGIPLALMIKLTNNKNIRD